MKNIKSVISLTVICAVIAVLLAFTNYITAPIIEKQENSAVNDALSVVLPDGKDFEQLNIADYELPATITEVYVSKDVGFVFKMSTSGYASGLVVMCGIDMDGNVVGATCIASNETNGVENDYGSKVIGATAQTIEKVDTVSGSTKTSLGYRNAIKDALNALIIVQGGSVDLRSEEEILADNLNSALPSANGKFTNIFLTEQTEKIKSAYKADNGKGYVFVLQAQNFIATDNNGEVISAIGDEIKAEISAEAKTIINSTLTEIDISKLESIPQIQKAYKTSSGNFVFEINAAGYGINGGDQWHPASGEPISIKVSATVDGKIISCVTVSQKETDGIGSACADASFYTQFNGKDKTNYTEIDAISGATITTNGYKNGVAKVFEAIEILKGVS